MADDKKKKLDMPAKILIGLGLGIGTGLFFGEIAAPLKVVGDTYAGLLQMTVLPYIVLALIGGIGKLNRQQATLMLTRVSLIIIALWAVGLTAVFLFGLALPNQVSASFFSQSLIEEAPPFNFFELFIPSNPFHALAENRVPAVVLFCVLCGAALIGYAQKQRVIGAIDVLIEMMGRVSGFIVGLSPYGVFFIAAAAAGTMDVTEIVRIQGYLVILTVICLALCFVVIPSVISSMTPFSNKDVSPLLRASFVLAFATGKTLVVLPMLIEGIRELYEKKDPGNDEAVSTTDIVVPLAYSFPHLGRILATAFIPFAAWYAGSPLPLDQFPLLLTAATFVHFSTAPVSIPFLLDLMQLPADLYQLFVVTGVYVGRLTDAVGAAYILAVAVLGTSAVSGTLSIQWRRIGLLGAGVAAFALVTVVGGRAYINATSSDSYNADAVLASMQTLPVDIQTTVVEPGPNPVPLDDGQSVLGRIVERGTIRVGFNPNALPFTYFNGEGQLVGFDVELVESLGELLDVEIEYVPISNVSAVGDELRKDFFDIAIGGFVNTIDNVRARPASEPYLYLNMALIVRDYRDKEFATMESIAELEALRIGYVASGSFASKVSAFLPEAELVPLESAAAFFEDSAAGLDALLFSAEAGSAWTMIHPQFSVMTPFPRNIQMPVVVPYSGFTDPEMDEFIDNWVLVVQHDGTLETAYDYWILGEGTESLEPRWSVIRNVLGWVD